MKFKKSSLFLILITFLLIWGSEEFLRRKVGGMAGLFPFAESWTLDIPEKELLNIIKKVKIKNPALEPPSDSLFIKDNYLDWWKVSFYYENSQEIVKVWVKSSYEDSTKSILLLDNFLSVGENSEFRKINRDFWYIENKIQINKFERLILKPIQDLRNTSE